LIHVVPTLELGGVYSTVQSVILNLNQYFHTVVHSTPIEGLQHTLVDTLQLLGCDVLQVDRLTAEALESIEGTGAIFYNTRNLPGLGEVLPSLYYSYGVYCPGVKTSITVACSGYAAQHDRTGNRLPTALDTVIPPLVATRGYRNIAGAGGPFTVGMLSSCTYNQYPYRLAQYLIDTLPAPDRLLLTRPPKTNVLDGLDRPNIISCKLDTAAEFRYTVNSDILVYGTDENHFTPYGRTVVEAMGLGKIVICENRGVFPTMLENNVNAILYSTVEEIPDAILRIKRDTVTRRRLSANAQLWASWQDTSIHIGKLKRLLRVIGA